jgi:hypothetical protein
MGGEGRGVVTQEAACYFEQIIYFLTFYFLLSNAVSFYTIVKGISKFSLLLYADEVIVHGSRVKSYQNERTYLRTRVEPCDKKYFSCCIK